MPVPLQIGWPAVENVWIFHIARKKDSGPVLFRLLQPELAYS